MDTSKPAAEQMEPGLPAPADDEDDDLPPPPPPAEDEFPAPPPLEAGDAEYRDEAARATWEGRRRPSERRKGGGPTRTYTVHGGSAQAVTPPSDYHADAK